MRIVVNLVGEPAHGLLAESRFVERSFLPGGEHNMYELAFAAAALGFDVELRGWLHRPAFDRLAAGAGVAPRVNLTARLPAPGELVVVPEGWQDPLEYARLLLSPARLAVFVLAPPGLFGWPFCEAGWTRPDPLTVPLDALGRPEHFQAMQGVGISILSHSPGIVSAAESTGVPCAFVGTGRPDPPSARRDATRSVDVAALMTNRWAPLVREVVGDLVGVSVDLIEECSNEEVLARLSQARVLLWPSRIEGHATIPWEARSVGCVPVALSTNRFAVGLHEGAGAVLVDRLGELAPAVRELLADDRRWHELSARAITTAPTEVDWGAYLDRVRSFLYSVAPAGPEHSALTGMGAALREWLNARSTRAQEALEEFQAEDQRLRADRDRLASGLAELRAERDRLASGLAELRAERDRLEQSLAALRARRAVKLALRLDAVRRRRTEDG